MAVSDGRRAFMRVTGADKGGNWTCVRRDELYGRGSSVADGGNEELKPLDPRCAGAEFRAGSVLCFLLGYNAGGL